MKKNFLRAALLLCLLLSVTVFAVACELGSSHAHTYDEKWTADDDAHWHAATCEHTDKMSDKAAHEFDDGIKSDVPVKTEDGKDGFEWSLTCAVCQHVKKEILPADETPATHACVATESPVARYLKSEATCREPATYYKSCLYCKVALKGTFKYGDVTDHTYKNGVCTVCGEKKPTDETPDECTHEYVRETTPATCTEGGYDTITCRKCGDTWTENPTDALGHDYVNGVCSRCNGRQSIEVTEEQWRRAFDTLHIENLTWQMLNTSSATNAQSAVYRAGNLVFIYYTDGKGNEESYYEILDGNYEYTTIYTYNAEKSMWMPYILVETNNNELYDEFAAKYSRFTYKDGVYSGEVAGGRAAVSFDSEGRLLTCGIPGLVMYTFTEYGTTEVELPENFKRCEHTLTVDTKPASCGVNEERNVSCPLCGLSETFYTPDTALRHEYKNGVCIHCGQKENTEKNVHVIFFLPNGTEEFDIKTADFHTIEEKMKLLIVKTGVNGFTVDQNSDKLYDFSKWEGEYTEFFYYCCHDRYVDGVCDVCGKVQDDGEPSGEILVVWFRLPNGDESMVEVDPQDLAGAREKLMSYVRYVCGIREFKIDGVRKNKTDGEYYDFTQWTTEDTYFYFIGEVVTPTEECEHDFQYNVVLPPTCTTSGTEIVTCTKCSYREERMIPLISHEYGNDGHCNHCGCTQKEAEDVFWDKIILRCKDSESYREAPIYFTYPKGADTVPEETLKLIVEKVRMYCDLWNVEGFYADGDSEFFDFTKWTPRSAHEFSSESGACEHEFIWQQVAESTCQTHGTAIYICSKCGFGDGTQMELPLADHVFVNGICQNCHTSVSDTCNHVWETEHKDPSCIERGYEIKVCYKCGTKDESSYVDLPKSGHVFNGNENCVFCGADRETSCMHAFELKETIAATCSESSTEMYVCMKCQYEKTTHETEATGHLFDENGVCTRCGEKMSSTVEISVMAPDGTPYMTLLVSAGCALSDNDYERLLAYGVKALIASDTSERISIEDLRTHLFYTSGSYYASYSDS